MHSEVALAIRGLHCWTTVKNGVLWWPELPPSAFAALNLQKNDLSTIFVRYFLHVWSSVPSNANTNAKWSPPGSSYPLPFSQACGPRWQSARYWGRRMKQNERLARWAGGRGDGVMSKGMKSIWGPYFLLEERLTYLGHDAIMRNGRTSDHCKRRTAIKA